MPFVAFMAKWLTTARGVRRTRPLSSISRCTTTLGNRYAPKKRVGSVTPAQDDGRETCPLGCCSYNGLWVSEPCNPAPHQVLWQQESPCVSGKGGPYCKQSKKRKGRVVIPAGRLKSWIEPFRGVMQKPRRAGVV